jgi:cyclase
MSPNGGWGESNAALICGTHESVLIDTLWDLPRTEAMLEGFGPHLETAPIRRVINTHGDGDHWFGNQLTGAKSIIATKAATRRMSEHGPGDMKMLGAASRALRWASGLPVVGRRSWEIEADYFDGMMAPFDFSRIRPTLPNTTFSGELHLEIGGRPVDLLEVGPAHTSGDLIVHMRDDRVVFAGDIIFLGTTPVLWDGSANRWIQACEQILRLKPDVVVPGHGPLTDCDGVDLVRQYWQFLWAAARRHMQKGVPPDLAALAIVRSDEFLHQPFAVWDGRERTMINVHAIYRRLLEHRRSIGTLEKLAVLQKTALLAELLNKE